jgi:hypothetical protein
LAEATIVTLTGSTGLTVIVTGAEVAGLPVAQVASEVSTQVTIFPLVGVYVNVLLLVPEFVPFTFH